MASKAIETYGLYNATFNRVLVPDLRRYESPWGKMPSNDSKGSPVKFKKVGFKKVGGGSNYGY